MSGRRAGRSSSSPATPARKASPSGKGAEAVLGLVLSRTYLSAELAFGGADVARCASDRLVHAFTVKQLNDEDREAGSRRGRALSSLAGGRSGRVCHDGGDGIAPDRATPRARQGPRRRAVRRAAHRRRPGPIAAGLSQAHFSREFRRAFGETPARLPADPAARAGCGDAPDDRPHRGGHLRRRRAVEPRVVHDDLHPGLREVARRRTGRASHRRRRMRSSRRASCVPTAGRRTARFEKTASPPDP